MPDNSNAGKTLSAEMQHVGRAVTVSLERHGIDRVFTVPGESYLAVLDGLHDSTIQNVVCRQEGGAVYMADAYGRATGTVGVAMVTRGPGAANAFVGIHTAWQDASPLILFVGLIPTADRDREAFQEFDVKAWFGTQAKRVLVLDVPERASEVVAEAFHAATSGRPGPVVVGLPEDVVAAPFTGVLVDPYPVAQGGISGSEIEDVVERLTAARHPLLFLAGEGWTEDAAATVCDFANRNRLPVLADWHGTWQPPRGTSCSVGVSMFGGPAHAVRALEQTDLLLCLGGPLTDTAIDSFRVKRAPDSITIVACMDSGLRGHAGRADVQLLASPRQIAAALSGISLPVSAERTAWANMLREEYSVFREPLMPVSRAGTASMTRVVCELAARVDDPVVTMGAGNHGAWAQFFTADSCLAELAPRNGSMGFSVPAAVAAALALPGRDVVALAGDGEFLMNGQELATAVQVGAAFFVVVMDNGQFGTIRGHQERVYPGRVSGTQLRNPDFALLARGFGAFAETVDDDAFVSAAVDRALAAVRAGRVAVLHVLVDADCLLP